MTDTPRPLSDFIESISVSVSEGSPRITLKMGDEEAVDYWAVQIGTSEHGDPVYKLLPMERG